MCTRPQLDQHSLKDFEDDDSPIVLDGSEYSTLPYIKCFFDLVHISDDDIWETGEAENTLTTFEDSVESDNEKQLVNFLDEKTLD